MKRVRICRSTRARRWRKVGFAVVCSVVDKWRSDAGREAANVVEMDKFRVSAGVGGLREEG
jgi:hypothetical protein